MLSEHPKEGEQPNMVGSVMLISGNSREEVLERIRTDIYTTSGVWDLEKMQVIPVRIIFFYILRRGHAMSC